MSNRTETQVRVKLDQDWVQIESAMSQLVTDLSHLQRDIKQLASARQVAVRLTACLLTAALLQERLCAAIIAAWNEV